MMVRVFWILAVVAFCALSQSSVGQTQSDYQELPMLDEGYSDSDFAPLGATGDSYQSYDGEFSETLWVSDELVMEYAAADVRHNRDGVVADEDIVASDGVLRIVKKQSWHESEDDFFPVLVSMNGSWKALPGGVIVVLAPDMVQAEIDAFFATLGLADLSKMDFTENAFLIETEPGIVGLELANQLAQTEGVVLASPNWWSPVELH